MGKVEVEALKKACDKAYDSNKTSCSNAIWDVIREIGDKNETYRVANVLLDHMKANWQSVSLEEGFKLANLGVLVVGGAKADPNGHVIAIYPGEKVTNGGYPYYYEKEKKYLTLKGNKQLPRCLSTSKSTWPGAMSKGDKTVWDPWGNDLKFSQVKFYTPKTNSGTSGPT